MAIGEAGNFTAGPEMAGQVIDVPLAEPLDTPVVALTASASEGQSFSLRIVDATVNEDGLTTAFKVQIEQWEYLDGQDLAGATQIEWLAVEKGVHELPDGRVIEAGTAEADHSDTKVEFAGEFQARPVVLTSVMSHNDSTTVDSDPTDITNQGFKVRVQEEEGQDRVHGIETVGFIAVEPGGTDDTGTAHRFSGVNHTEHELNLGDSFDNPVVLGDTQTIKGGNTEALMLTRTSGDSVGAFVAEEQSRDSETRHIDEDIGIVAFEAGLIPCFTAGTLVDTPHGAQAVETLQQGDRVTLYGGGARALRAVWAGHRKPVAGDLPGPVRIVAGALGQGLPRRALRLSPQHRVLVRSAIGQRMFGCGEVLVAAQALVGLPGISVDNPGDAAPVYLHLVLDRHTVLLAEGAPVESFLAGAEAERTLAPAARECLGRLFPMLRHGIGRPVPARPIPTPRQQKRLATRHLRNRQPLLLP